MNRKKEKPTYGNSQGSKSSELSGDRDHKKSSASSRQQYAQSGEFTEQKKQQDRSSQSSLVMLDSLPRKIFKVSMIALILYPLLVYTPIGKSIVANGYQIIAKIKQKMGTHQSEVNLKNMGERRQKAADDRFNDRLKQAGDDSAKKRQR